MRCQQIQELLTDYLFQELPESERIEVKQHLETCEVCRKALEELGEIVSDVRESVEIPAFSEEHIDAVVKAAESADIVKPFRKRIMIWLPAAATIVMGFFIFQAIQERGRVLEPGVVDISDSSVSTSKQLKARAEIPPVIVETEVLKEADEGISIDREEKAMPYQTHQYAGSGREYRDTDTGSTYAPEPDVGQEVEMQTGTENKKKILGKQFPSESSNGHGSVYGRITDSEGKPLSGVMVQATSPDQTVGSKVTVTDHDGNYKFSKLREGEYRITSKLDGFHESIEEKIQVKRQATTGLQSEMKSTFSKPVTVTAQSPVVDPPAKTIDGSSAIDQEVPKSPKQRSQTEKKENTNEYPPGTIVVTGQAPVVDTSQTNTGDVYAGTFHQEGTIGARGTSIKDVTGTSAAVQSGDKVNSKDSSKSRSQTEEKGQTYKNRMRSDSFSSWGTSKIGEEKSSTKGPIGSLEGKITDRMGNPLPGVIVQARSSGKTVTAVTDNTGNFKFTELESGEYKISHNLDGFQPLVHDKIPVKKDMNTKIESSLSNAGEFAEEIVVSRSPVVEISPIKSSDSYIDTTRTHTGDVYTESFLQGKREQEEQFMDQASGGSRPRGGSEEAFKPATTAPPAPHDRPDDTYRMVPPNGYRFDAMYFDHAGVNPFILTEEDPLSTFAVDVDTASYKITRNYLDRNVLPPRDVARVEEFVNAFDQGYPEEHSHDFTIHLDGAPSPFGEGYHLLRVGLTTRTVSEEERKPLNLTFVIDVSGSMSRENRLGLVKKGLKLLVNRLDEQDRVGIAVYGSRGEDYFQHDTMDARGRDNIIQAIDHLRAGGSTNAEEGLKIGYRMATGVFDKNCENRVILCSDGVANVGRTGPDAILETIRASSSEGIFLTSVGVGMGNYNDVLMERLADAGNGIYTYIDTMDEAREFFLQDLTGLLETVAKDVKIQVEFDPKTVERYRLLGYENRDVADRDFRNDAVDAGEVNSGHTVTALYELKTRGRRGQVGTVRVRYKKPLDDRAVEIAQPIDRKQFARTFNNADPYLQVDALVAEFAEFLRGSYWARGSSFDAILDTAAELDSSVTGRPQVREFLELVKKARRLAGPAPGNPNITN